MLISNDDKYINVSSLDDKILKYNLININQEPVQIYNNNSSSINSFVITRDEKLLILID